VDADQDDEGLMPGLLELAAAGDIAALQASVEEHFNVLGPREMATLQLRAAEDPSTTNPANAVASAIQSSVTRRMDTAKDLILELLEQPSGNVVADVKRTLKKAENPLPLLMVLQLNVQQAQQEQDEEKLKALTHIYTLINEEMEKKVSKVQGLLNKLLRMENPNIRDNLLRHHLQPAPVAAAPGLDDFDDEDIEDPSQLNVGKEEEKGDENEDIQPMDAFQLNTSDLTTEMERRGLQVKGFFNDDAKLLQQAFDAEHDVYVEQMKKERMEKRARAKKAGWPAAQADAHGEAIEGRARRGGQR